MFKKIQYFSLFVGLVFGSMTFTACGDDDDDSSSDDKSKQEQGGGGGSQAYSADKISMLLVEGSVAANMVEHPEAETIAITIGAAMSKRNSTFTVNNDGKRTHIVGTMTDENGKCTVSFDINDNTNEKSSISNYEYRRETNTTQQGIQISNKTVVSVASLAMDKNGSWSGTEENGLRFSNFRSSTTQIAYGQSQTIILALASNPENYLKVTLYTE